MPAAFRTTLALVAGLVITFLTISVSEQLSHLLFRPPVDLDWQDSSAVAAYLKQLPVSALLLVLVGWLVGIAAGLSVATLIAGRSRGRFALAIGGLVWLAALSNFYLLPHPLWMVVLSLCSIPLLSYGLWWLLRRQIAFKRMQRQKENG